MDIGKAITFAFEDEDWPTKLGLGAVVSAVPLLNFAMNGYMIDVIRNVARGDEKPLPEWTDLGDKFVRGLVVSVAVFIYFLPAILIGCLALTSFTLPAFAANEDFVEGLAMASTGLGLALMCCLGLFALVMSFFMPAVYINYARQGTFAACFRLGELWAIIRDNLNKYLTAVLMTIVVGIFAGTVLSFALGILAVIPCLGVIAAWVVNAVAAVWMSTIYAHLLGQVSAAGE